MLSLRSATPLGFDSWPFYHRFIAPSSLPASFLLLPPPPPLSHRGMVSPRVCSAISSQAAVGDTDLCITDSIKKKKKSQKPVYTRPNYFIGTRVDDEVVVAAIRSLQKRICAHRYDLQAACIRPARLHFTLVVLSLKDEQEVQLASDVLETTMTTHTTSLDRIQIATLGTFGSGVLFARPDPQSRQALQDLHQALASQLGQAGLQIIGPGSQYNLRNHVDSETEPDEEDGHVDPDEAPQEESACQDATESIAASSTTITSMAATAEESELWLPSELCAIRERNAVADDTLGCQEKKEKKKKETSKRRRRREKAAVEMEFEPHLTIMKTSAAQQKHPKRKQKRLEIRLEDLGGIDKDVDLADQRIRRVSLVAMNAADEDGYYRRIKEVSWIHTEKEEAPETVAKEVWVLKKEGPSTA